MNPDILKNLLNSYPNFTGDDDSITEICELVDDLVKNSLKEADRLHNSKELSITSDEHKNILKNKIKKVLNKYDADFSTYYSKTSQSKTNEFEIFHGNELVMCFTMNDKYGEEKFVLHGYLDHEMTFAYEFWICESNEHYFSSKLYKMLGEIGDLIEGK